MSIRVCHLIAGSPDEGAARGAYWLHTALTEYTDIDSTVISNYVFDIDLPKVYAIPKNSSLELYIASYQNYLVFFQKYFFDRLKDLVWFTGIFVINNSALENADIIHLH